MHVRQRLGASERHACHVLGQPRSTQRRVKKLPGDEEALRTDVIRLASRFGRYGYRQITNLLRIEGWEVNHKRVERIWRQEGLKVPRRQPKRGRLWLNDGSCIRLRPLHKNHVWSYDFVSTRTHDGRALKLLTVLDEYDQPPRVVPPTVLVRPPPGAWGEGLTPICIWTRRSSMRAGPGRSRT